MSSIQNSGPWTASSRPAATLLAPVAASGATGLSFAAAAATDLAVGVFGRTEAMSTPATHKYINRPGSPPRGRLR